jgi:Asp-tRNA(Asn)/Glu-tRNA(Gln) amidotransferase A subunit family amidase
MKSIQAGAMTRTPRTQTEHVMKSWCNPNIESFARAVAGFRSGSDTPRDLLERCIANIEAREREVKAFVTLDLKGARKAADESSKRYKAGQPLSMVDGCPVGIKDIMATKDMPTQMNSAAFKGWQSGQDAACVHALRHGGAILIGKTVTTEFAIGYSGPTTNPFDSTRTPGGSSSGSAAGVGAGMLPAALGTQTQGSTLRPASFCGAVGFKPTLGALHTAGIHPLSATCDHLGVIAATLDDTWRVASHISLALGSPGYGFLDGAAANAPEAVMPRRMIRLYTRGWNEIDDTIKSRFEEAVDALQAAGVEIVGKGESDEVGAFEDALERDVDGALDIVAYEMKWPYEDYLARFGDAIGKRIHGLIERAHAMAPADYTELLQKRQAIRRQCRELAVALDADCYLTLASSGPAPLGLEHSGSRTFIAYGSWLGFPAFSLPVLESGGLPFGLQLLGLDHRDGVLCANANWVMKQLGGRPGGAA